MVEHKCYRKGGRRTATENPFGFSLSSDGQLNKDYSIRAKQFAAFAALRGFDKLLEDVRREAAKEGR